MPAGTHVGFFTVSNGASDSGNKTLLTNAAAGTSNQIDAMAAIASKLSIQVDANGNGHILVGNSQMNGDVFFTHNKSLNTDFNGSADIDHMASGVSSACRASCSTVSKTWPAAATRTSTTWCSASTSAPTTSIR